MTDKELRKKKITEKRREQILKAAMEIFSRKGYAAATIPEIAGAASIAAGTIYIYYPSKRELFIAVIKNLIITTPLIDLIDKIPRVDITDTFKNIIKNRFDLIRSEMISRIPSFMAEIQRDPELKALWAEQFLRPFMARLEGIYRALAASGRLRPLEPEVAARVVGGMILGFLMLKIMEGDTSPLNQLDQDKVADDIAGFIMHGLLNEKGAKKHRREADK
jgi:AcrR family transcriptional regulator